MLDLHRTVAVAFLCALAASCGNANAGVTTEVSLADLPCQMTNATGVWESAPFPPITDDQCLWFGFAANSTYIFEHPLGRVPFDVIGYIAFGSDGSASTIASGNAFLILETDDTTVTVRNGQNQFFWLRLALD